MERKTLCKFYANLWKQTFERWLTNCLCQEIIIYLFDFVLLALGWVSWIVRSNITATAKIWQPNLAKCSLLALFSFWFLLFWSTFFIYLLLYCVWAFDLTLGQDHSNIHSSFDQISHTYISGYDVFPLHIQRPVLSAANGEYSFSTMQLHKCHHYGARCFNEFTTVNPK